jgi:hypothetical protein
MKSVSEWRINYHYYVQTVASLRPIAAHIDRRSLKDGFAGRLFLAF